MVIELYMDDNMEMIRIWVYTVILSKNDIKTIYAAICEQCPEYDLPLYLPLEGGDGSGCHYLVATPIDFAPEHMRELLDKFNEKFTMNVETVVPAEQFNQHYVVNLKDTLGINLGSYCLSEKPTWRLYLD